jgi:hypothetical protein
MDNDFGEKKTAVFCRGAGVIGSYGNPTTKADGVMMSGFSSDD